ncbi:MAG: hypothetical protein ABSC63_16320 [Candidatus Binataceae bacterium]|jgi:hypothetical protein
MLPISNNSLLQRVSYWSAFFLAILLSACAQSAAQLQTPTTTTKNKAALVEELESAKQQDWRNALDPHVAPSEEEDFLDQMNKADRALKELTHGFKVPQSEIEEALMVPPKSLSSRKRLQLIRQLQDAVQQCDRNEQAMLNDLAWSDSVAPMDTFTFDQQKALAESVIKDLEIGEEVHWSTIKEALVVPQNPY